jgi:hypothetical protein
VTLVDTPGILSGEKQRIGRTYEFTSVIEWFSSRCDVILLLFDAHKLDISDEFKNAIEALRGQDDKIRVVLNKADAVDAQKLIRIYGALMWSLGKVIKTPECVRVYIGSFWEEPLRCGEWSRELLQKEMADLLNDLKNVPKNAAVRKVNELVKRVRLLKAHVHIIGHLKKEMPSMFGKEKTQNKLLANLEDHFLKVRATPSLAPHASRPMPRASCQLDDRHTSILAHTADGRTVARTGWIAMRTPPARVRELSALPDRPPPRHRRCTAPTTCPWATSPT